MKNTSELKPTTIDGLKRLAKRIKKEKDIKHHEALDLAAKQSGYENYAHAVKHME